MTLFQFSLSLFALFFFLFARDGIQRKKLNMVHFVVFGLGSIIITWLAFDITTLNRFGSIFGVARGADLIVYVSIILLGYLFFGLLHRSTKQEESLTRLVSQLAIQNTQFADRKYWSISTKSQCIIGMRSYNESQTLVKVIDDIVLYGFNTIVIVDDGSRDHTTQIIADKQSQYPDINILVVSHAINRGPWAANKTLFATVLDLAQSHPHLKWLITVDADDQMNIADTSKFLNIIQDVEQSKSQTQIILGSRFVTGGQTSNLPRTRKCILMWSKLVTYLFNGIRLSDPHNGFRWYDIRILDRIVISSDRFSYANEINDCIYRHHLIYQEIPVYIKYTDYSLSKWQQSSSAWKILKELIYKKFFFR